MDNPFLERVYRITYASGRIGSVCSRRSLGGKIGYHNEQMRKKARGHYVSKDFVITKIESVPIDTEWDDVTEQFNLV